MHPIIKIAVEKKAIQKWNNFLIADKVAIFILDLLNIKIT